MRFRLRYLKHNLELSPGTFVIGRSAECQLSLDDPLVSRRHALLLVGDTDVFLEDAGSRNGVLVNGVKMAARTRLVDGDKVTIGAQEMALSSTHDTETQPKRTFAQTPATAGPVTLVTIAVADKSEVISPASFPSHSPHEKASPPDDSTIERPRRGESLKLLGGVADKALALGNPEGAERLLNNGLIEIAADVKAGRPVPTDSIDLAARFAARLATGTGKGSWGDYAIQLYSQRGHLPPASIVDELYIASRKMKGFDLTSFRKYLTAQHARAADLTPTERFVLQRLDGLERLVASR
ncbi:MAG: hypothetical protein NVS3B20_17970 [Polyangiales bacterium]